MGPRTSACFLLLGIVGACAVGMSGCKGNGGTTEPAGTTPDSATTGASTDADLAALEDARQAQDVRPDALSTRDLPRKRRLARALARIADERSADILLDALPLEDPETLAYVSYGLGFACSGREEKHVRALAARFASLPPSPLEAAGATFDVRTTFLRAMAHCGGELAESTLRAALGSVDDLDRTRAAFALGDMASRRRTLSADSVSALLAAAAGDQTHAATIAAFYPLSRLKADTELPVVEAAKRALSVQPPAPDRIFAIRALAKGGPAAIPELLAIVKDAAKFRPEERAEAARALGLTGALGQAAVGEALTALMPAKDPFAVSTLGSALYGILSNLLDGVKDDPPKALAATLGAIANFRAPGDPGGTLGRRIGALRCKAAAVLARGSMDAEVLVQCDAKGSFAWESARLAALVKRPLLRERRTAWIELSNSKDIRIREEALKAVEQHGELSDAGRTAIVSALQSRLPGLTAVAAEVLFKRPERAFEVSSKERKAALDPRAPPPAPFETPDKELDPRIASALHDALSSFSWPEDAVETRTQLLDAAAALHLKGAASHAKKNCVDPNVTVRKRAQAALRLLGEELPCSTVPAGTRPPLPPILAKDTRVVFRTDAGELGITLSPVLAPNTATRVLALVNGGFYKNMVVHRVVPGFVVQFGDPGGDGYGGSGTLVRCETAPAPFEPLSVGIALAGRDTGSSQLFITLSRTPHLDGEYSRVGHADGDWASVAEGDLIQDARVAEQGR